MLFDLGTHLIDQALALFGPVVAVYAEIETRSRRLEVDDDAFVALTHASGVRSHLWASHVAADPARGCACSARARPTSSTGSTCRRPSSTPACDPASPGFGEEPRDAWGALSRGRAVATGADRAG